MDVEPTGTATYEVGLLLEVNEEAPADDRDREAGQDDIYTDAAGRHRSTSGGGLGTPARLVPRLGEAAVRTAARAVASQVALVADEIRAELERRSAATAPGNALDIDEAKITFGLKLTASSGAGLSALFTAKSESNVEVAITVRRQTT